MDLGIAGKNAIITGASSGIGKAVADALAAEGVNIALFARRGEILDAIAKDLSGRHGIDARAVAGDMRERNDVKKLAAVADEMGGPDILILNTGRPPVPMREILDETDDARWEDAYRTQLWGAVLVVQEIVPRIVARGWGRIVAVTSLSVKQPMPHHGLSTVFRASLTGFLKHLANEVGQSGVTVNAVCPGSVDTRAPDRHDMAGRLKRIPLGRLGLPEELSGTVAFLASRQAGFITGASLQVDGGTVGSLV